MDVGSERMNANVSWELQLGAFQPPAEGGGTRARTRKAAAFDPPLPLLLRPCSAATSAQMRPTGPRRRPWRLEKGCRSGPRRRRSARSGRCRWVLAPRWHGLSVCTRKLACYTPASMEPLRPCPQHALPAAVCSAFP